jgi:hypothetical protein
MGGAGFNLTVTGSNFVSTSVVQWNGSPRSTTYIDNTTLIGAIDPTDITASGSFPVTVTTPAPGGGSSTAIAMTVQYPLPGITSLAPSTVVIGSSGFSLVVNGSNFANGATVYWNSVARVTHFVNPTQITADILTSDLTAANTINVTVQNPSPSAGVSNVSAFTVGNPVPAISSISPTSAIAGTSFSIDINGSGFLSSSTVQLGTQTLQPTSTTSTQITVQVKSPAVASLLPLSVTNPPPGGGSSPSVSFKSVAAGPPTPSTLASVDSSGMAIDASSGAMSTDARYVAFGADVRDTCVGVTTGCISSTLLFSSNADTAYAVSDDGRYVATQLGSNGNADLKFWDTCFGVLNCTPISVTPSNLQVVPSGGIWMTPNARYLAYSTGAVTDAMLPTYVYDTCVGALPGCTPTLISTNDSTPGGFASTTSNAVSMSSDGRYLAFEDPNWQITLRDTCLGGPVGCVPSDQVLSATGITCEHPALSADAQYITYSCRVPGMHVLLQNTCVGASGACTPVSTQLTDPGTNSNAPLISGNGRYVAFVSLNAVIAGQTLPFPTVYVFDTCNGASGSCTPQELPACLAADGAIANDACSLWGISNDGRRLLISTPATNMATLPDTVTNGLYVTPNPLP